jgi:hypothetical protein
VAHCQGIFFVAEEDAPAGGCYEDVWAQQNVTKKVCLTPFGMEWKTSEEAKTHLVAAAKRAAVGELFGEMIQSITEVRNFQLQRDDIEVISIGFLRVQGTPEFYQGSGFGEICTKINAHILEEDIQRFRPRTVERKVCVADPLQHALCFAPAGVNRTR